MSPFAGGLSQGKDIGRRQGARISHERYGHQTAQQIFVKAEKAINENRYLDLRRMLNNLYNLLVFDSLTGNTQERQKGMGIR